MASIDRHPGGRWRARWRTPDGKSRSQVFDRKLDAERHLTALEHSKLVGAYVDPAAGKITVADYWADWSARQSWRESSRRSATSTFNCHVLPAFGTRGLASLRRGEIEAWAAGLPLAPRTANRVTVLLGTMLHAAVADGLIAANPARGAKRPRVDGQPVVPFTDGEIEALRAAAPDWFAVALTLGLGAGLRQAEATGLTLDRIDFLRRELTVDRQLLSLKAGEMRWGPPSQSGPTARCRWLTPWSRALARHVELHGVGDHGLVLHGPTGRAMAQARFGYVWRTMRRRAGLPEARFHDGRHTFASTLLSGGVSVAAAAEYLGHTPAVLLSTYAHLLPADHDRARQVVEAAFGKSWRVTGVSPGSVGASTPRR
jgi:integrase